MWIFGIWTKGYKEAEDSASMETISFLLLQVMFV